MVQTSFDASAATATYLASIPADRLARATAYTHGQHWLLLWTWLVSVAASLIIARSGLLVRIDRSEERFSARPNRTVFFCVLLFVGARFLLQLPWAIYADWWRETSYGLSSTGFAAWLVQSVISTIVTALIGGLLMMAVYALIRRAGRRWWLWSALVSSVAVFFAIALAPVVFGPVLHHYQPVPAGENRTSIEALARQTGIPGDQILMYDGSKDTNRYTATVEGIGPVARIVLSDTMLKAPVDLASVRAIVAHEIGHYVHYHLILLSVAISLLVALGLFLIDRCYGWTARRILPARTALSRPSGLPVLAIIFATYTFVMTPVVNTAERSVELDADRYGLRVANEPDGAARGLMRTVDYRASSPGPLEEALFYEHPSIAHRVRLAMDWKAAHPPAASGPAE